MKVMSHGEQNVGVRRRQFTRIALVLLFLIGILVASAAWWLLRETKEPPRVEHGRPPSPDASSAQPDASSQEQERITPPIKIEQSGAQQSATPAGDGPGSSQVPPNQSGRSDPK